MRSACAAFIPALTPLPQYLTLQIRHFMSDDILIVRDGDVYRVLFGHLRLSSMLSQSNEAFVNVKGEGLAKVVKTAKGLHVAKAGFQLPLL